MKRFIVLIILGALVSSCSGPDKSPAIVFMPDMYYSVAYEPYQKATFGYPDYTETSEVNVFSENFEVTALAPVEGTVPHTNSGILPYNLPDTNEGYDASKNVQSPLNTANREKDLARGEKLFNQVCAVCHGVKGDGQGSIVLSGAYVGVPTYDSRDITVGSVYHVIMYGRNAMGSYAPQLNQEDRWRVAEYVMQLRNNN
ncbi:c-type cytochrome [Flavobacteriaceae bacterium Ap0902]|nr:c-type cytochrome [Flavobacteriaceae bacterium Ap0902]